MKGHCKEELEEDGIEEHQHCRLHDEQTGKMEPKYKLQIPKFLKSMVDFNKDRL